MALTISFDDSLVEVIATKFDLRAPNRAALEATVKRLAAGDFDPQTPLVLNMATGAGKTYIMAALIEYLRECGHTNVMVVTPGRVIQSKTVANFTRSSRKYIGGFDVPPQITTPVNLRGWNTSVQGGQAALTAGFVGSQVFVFNVQNLLAPKKADQATTADTVEARRAKIRKFDENSGNLYAHLQGLDDLVILADESHLYGSDAVAFNAALKELVPAATIGLTASAEPGDDVVYRYPLYQAIIDRYVKQPVIVYRKSGYDRYPDAEERQLRDGLAVLRAKAAAYKAYVYNNPDVKPVRPVMLVTCSDIEHATATAKLLAGPGYVGDSSRVLQVDSKHDDEQTRTFLENIDEEHSTIEAVVSVGKLREGWDARSVAVIVSLRALASEVLTQQTMGRGLRLPFGSYTGMATIDQLDIISHRSFRDYLRSEDALETFGIDEKAAGSHEVPVEVTSGDGTVEGHNVPSSELAAGDGKSDVPVSHTDTPVPEPAEDDGDHPVVEVREVDDDAAIPAPQEVQEPVVVRMNEQFAGQSFMFPSSEMVVATPKFDLAEITDEQVRVAAAAVNVEGVTLSREKITADDGEVRLEKATNAIGGVDSVDDDTVYRELVRAAVGSRTFEQTEGNLQILERRIVRMLMDAVSFSPWTEKALESGRREIHRLLTAARKSFVASRTDLEVQVTTRVLPVRPSATLAVGREVLPPLDAADLRSFEVGQYYGPWEKCLFTAASFDSGSAEYRLADMLNFDPEVKWWTRLYSADEARFAWSGGTRYYHPDFVVCDVEGNYWIVEAKADNRVEDDEVVSKREAANKVMRKLTGDPRFIDQWGYLFASESDIKSVETWHGLKERTRPVTS